MARDGRPVVREVSNAQGSKKDRADESAGKTHHIKEGKHRTVLSERRGHTPRRDQYWRSCDLLALLRLSYSFPHNKRPREASSRGMSERILINRDANNKTLVEALIAPRVSCEQVVLSYMGESMGDAASTPWIMSMVTSSLGSTMVTCGVA